MRIITSSNFENLIQTADVRFTPDELARMRGDGMHIVSDPEIAETDVMQGVKSRKTDIRGLVGRIALPRIMYPSASDIVELDGRQYYVIFVAEPKPRKNPEGTVYMLDVETGEPHNMPFMQIASRLHTVKADKVRASAEEINTLIKKWNKTIEKIGKVINPSTWPMQLLWSNSIVDERLNELAGQEQALMAKLDEATNFSPSFSQSLERLKTDLIAGIIPQSDIYDTAMFIQQNDPDAIQSILSSASLPPEVRSKIEALVTMRNEEIEKEKSKNQNNEQERQTRIDAPSNVEGMLSPGEQALMRIDDQDVENYTGKKMRTPDRYFGPKSRVSQIRTTLDGIRKNKVLVTGAKEALDNLREFIGRLEKGERARSILMNTERGTEIKRQVAQFVHKANSFLRSYKVPVFVKNETTGTYDLNKKLLGTSGGPGNAKVAIVINHMLSIIMSGLKEYAAPQAAPDQDGVGIEDGELDMSEIFNAGAFDESDYTMPIDEI